jgi:hypothetical protein
MGHWEKWTKFPEVVRMSSDYKSPDKQARILIDRRLLLAGIASLALLFAVLVEGGPHHISSRYAPSTPPPEPTPTPWPVPVQFSSPELGINIHMWWDPWASAARDWQLIEEGGFTWVKQRLAWHDVEGAGHGRYEWESADRIVNEAEQAGVKLVLRVDMPPVWAMPEPGSPMINEFPVYPDALRDFCNVLATRYQGRVQGYQVWNEPNLAREWRDLPPNPAAYVELLRACYLGVKAADSQALVISAGLAPTGSGPPEAMPDADYLIGMYEAGAALYYDLLGLNAPGYKAPPEISPAEVAEPDSGYGGHPTFCFRHVEDMRAIMESYGDGYKQVAIMEFGWHTNSNPIHQDYAWFAVTPEQQADYLVRAYQYAQKSWSSWIGPMFVWNFPDSHWTPDEEEFWWAIVDPFWWGFDGDKENWAGGGIRPAYAALKALNNP